MAQPPAPVIASIGVIVGRDLVGDALIKLPMLRALRAAYPQAEINWITSNGPTAYAGALKAVTGPLIDRIWETPDWLGADTGEAAANTNPPAFDLLIDTRNRWKLARQAKLIPHKVFLAQAFHYLFSERRPAWFHRHPAHLVDRLLELVELAAGYKPAATGRVAVPEEFMAKARAILPPGPTYIGLAPGAGNRVKAWPRFKFERLAAMQAAKGRTPVFLLGPAELSWFDELSAVVPEAKFPLQAIDIWGGVTISIEQTLAIGSLLTLAVANDSGTGHMLAAVDCPLVSLFGPTSPDKLAPRLSHGRIVKAQDFGGEAMRYITWEAADEAIESCLLELKLG